MIGVGDIVSPVTPAGLWLADVPVDGSQGQSRESVCVLVGEGVVVEVCDVVVDYDSWEDVEIEGEIVTYRGLGTVPYRNLLVESEVGRGWTGEGAVRLAVVGKA